MTTGLFASGGKEIIDHRIEGKETLFRISLMYNSTVADILEANPRISPKHIHTGMVVKVPKNTKMRDPAFVASFLNGPTAEPTAAVEEKIEKPVPAKSKAPVQATAHLRTPTTPYAKAYMPASGIVVEDRSDKPVPAATHAAMETHASRIVVDRSQTPAPINAMPTPKDQEPIQAMTHEQAKAQIRAQRGQPAEEKIAKPEIVKENAQPEIIKETTPEELRAEQIAAYERSIAREEVAKKSAQNTSYIPVRITSTSQIKDEAVQSKIETPVQAPAPTQKEYVKIETPVDPKIEAPAKVTTPVEVKPIESKPANTEAVQPTHGASVPAHIEDENPFLTPSEPAAKEDHSIEYQIIDPSSVKSADQEDENPFAVPAKRKEEQKPKPAAKSNGAATITSEINN